MSWLLIASLYIGNYSAFAIRFESESMCQKAAAALAQQLVPPGKSLTARLTTACVNLNTVTQ